MKRKINIHQISTVYTVIEDRSRKETIRFSAKYPVIPPAGVPSTRNFGHTYIHTYIHIYIYTHTYTHTHILNIITKKVFIPKQKK